jgi:hypothetical protein
MANANLFRQSGAENSKRIVVMGHGDAVLTPPHHGLQQERV